jgi:hypothetical protein
VQTALQLCAANDPGSEHWSEESFVGRLTEYAEFDRHLYAELANAITGVAKSPTVADVWCLLRILERVTLLIGCHLDPTDGYRIANLTDEEVADFNNEFRNRLRELSWQGESAS